MTQMKVLSKWSLFKIMLQDTALALRNMNVHCAKLVLLKVSIISKLVHHLKVSIILKLVLTKLELSVSKTLVLLKVSIIFQETLF